MEEKQNLTEYKIAIIGGTGKEGKGLAFGWIKAGFKVIIGSRVVEKALGEVSYEVTEREAASREFRRSLFVVQDIKAGEAFTEQNVRCIRPAHGLHPRYLDQVSGRRAAQDIERGTPLSWELIA